MSDYAAFLQAKTHSGSPGGFAPLWMPDFLFDFQVALTEWAIRQGRAAIFADCGLGKTPMQLVWAENVRRHTKKAVLVLTPIAVGIQTVAEGQKFGIVCRRCRDGIHESDEIVVANYERLHLFDPSRFAGLVCDESSILKHFSGATQQAVTEFARKLPYRLLCTATAAPNDYVELGTSSEALGVLGHQDMLGRFFRQIDSNFSRIVTIKHKADQPDRQGRWRLKGHAVVPFWRWVATWARAARKPSDVGPFDNGSFILPPLQERDHVVTPKTPPAGMLFTLAQHGLQAERDERRRTMVERIGMVAQLVTHTEPAVIWCHMNSEGDALERAIPGAKQIKGDTSDEEREQVYHDFSHGRQRVLIIKPKIGAWGMNWQHCRHVVTFASHSYEQHYQAIRRCWRFGQTQPVTVDIISTEGESHVKDNMLRKSKAADLMFDALIAHMQHAQAVARPQERTAMEVPAWL